MSTQDEHDAGAEKTTSGAAVNAADYTEVILGFIKEDEINTLWAERYKRSGHDVSEAIAVMSELEADRQTWEVSFAQLGYPNLQFDLAQRRLTLNRNLLTDVRLYLSTPSGLNARQAVKIEQSDASHGKVLQMVLTHEHFHFEQHAQKRGELQVHWSAPATYAIEGDRLSAERFKQHFEPLKQMRIATLAKPASVFLQDVYIYFDCFEHLGVMEVRPLVYVEPQVARSSKIPELASSTETTVLAFSVVAFPATALQTPPLDKEWAIGLFAPAGSLTWSTGGVLALYYLADYIKSDTRHSSIPADAHPSQGLLLTPLVMFCDRGGDQIELELMPAGSQATWAAQGTVRGELLTQNGNHFYKPPQDRTPIVQFNQRGDTFIPAAYRSSLTTPTATDVIQASAEGKVALATFIIRWVQPTHFIRVAKQAGELKLSLHYLNIDQQEKAVPDAQVSWQVVAGNGSVTSGLFKPAVSDPSAFSVVVGVDKANQDEWRWGMTIVALPMLDIDALVDVYSR